MSQAVEKTLPVGPVQLYWGDVRLGGPKSTFVVRHNTETVQSKQEDTGLNVGSHKTGEIMEVDVVISEFKLHQLRYVYAAANEFASTPVINALAYDASTSTVMRFNELHKLSGTANVTIDGAGYVDGTIKVWKSDFSNTPDGYTQGTDYTADSAAGTVARIGGGDINDQDTVYIEYNQSATVERMGFGGELADFEATFRAVHKLADGKQVQFYAHRAKKTGASDIAIAMADAFAGVPMTFHILADLAQPVSKQLGHWTKEA
ncbi:MAG: hypothetical protein KAT74_03850 [Candidatus Cloacimonetes bacterium]|nr:hypothetical protein [Candidatus Cloacimonadota bacterium]